ncbi:MAG: glycerol dehydratase reactivase beta/small subunit family protein [Tissierellales bacterium]|nr:glycerol dehydratase reactivase beta/small subunit family protein [Tissierellales bacterium]
MEKDKDTEKPRIYIFINNEIKDNIKEMFLGIEEEGIPFEVKKFTDYNSKKLASMASDTSLLGVGIGIDKKNIILHHEKLEPDKYVFSISLNSKFEMLREMGECAARIVKKVPFKNKYL